MKSVPLIRLPDGLSESVYTGIWQCNYSNDYPAEGGFSLLIFRAVLIEVLKQTNNSEAMELATKLSQMSTPFVVVASDQDYEQFPDD